MSGTDYNGVQLTSHGYGGYSRGCKCDTCRQAKADYMRTRRKKARAVARQHTELSAGQFHFVPGICHGRVGYEEHGCRCPDCRAGRAASDRAKPRRRRAAAPSLLSIERRAAQGKGVTAWTTEPE